MSAVGYVVKSMVVTIQEGAGSAVAYECAIRGVTEEESSDTVTTRTACPDGTKTDSGPSAWSVTVDYNVSNLPASLHRILRENAGAAATLSVEPFPVEEPGVTVEYDVTLRPGAAAYNVGAFGEASVTLSVTGSPRTVDPTP